MSGDTSNFEEMDSSVLFVANGIDITIVMFLTSMVQVSSIDMFLCIKKHKLLSIYSI